MTYLRWTVRIVVFSLIVGFLHYTLPQRDIVQIVQAESRITNVTGWASPFYGQPDAGDPTSSERDIRYVRAVLPGGNPREYRNEDTGFGWPPFFKINSDTIQTRAATAASQQSGEDWFVVRHYGWRWNAPTIFPNVLSIRAAAGPTWDDFSVWQRIPWFNLAVLTFLFAAYWAISVRVKRFWETRIAPLYSDD